MNYTIYPGMKKELKTKVMLDDTAIKRESGGIEVLSTVTVIQYFEKISFELMEANLPDILTTVGISIDISHIAPTPVGMEVVFSTELIEMEKKLVFEVSARDEKEVIAKGKHERFIVDKAQFLEKAYGKLK